MAELPVAVSAALLDRIRVRNVGGVCGGCGDHVPSDPAPTFLFIVLRDGGPPTMIGLDALDQGTDQRPKLAVGPTWWRST